MRDLFSSWLNSVPCEFSSISETKFTLKYARSCAASAKWLLCVVALCVSPTMCASVSAHSQVACVCMWLFYLPLYSHLSLGSTHIRLYLSHIKAVRQQYVACFLLHPSILKPWSNLTAKLLPAVCDRGSQGISHHTEVGYRAWNTSHCVALRVGTSAR